MSPTGDISFRERRNWSSKRLGITLGFEPRPSDSAPEGGEFWGSFCWPLKIDFVVWIIAALPYFSTYLFFPIRNRITRGGGLIFIEKIAYSAVLFFYEKKKVGKYVNAPNYRTTLPDVEGIIALENHHFANTAIVTDSGGISGCWAHWMKTYLVTGYSESIPSHMAY